MSYPFERLDRDRGPVKGHVFVVMPYGKREVVNDNDETIVTDFDQLYQDHYVPVIESIGMKPVRGDSLYSDETILGNVWCGLQEGDIVVVELTGSNSNVMIEFGWAYLLGKKLMPLTQCRKDIVACRQSSSWKSAWRRGTLSAAGRQGACRSSSSAAPRSASSTSIGA
jgi:hypothetical protein